MPELARKPGAQTLVQPSTASDGAAPAPGKQTLTAQLGAGAGHPTKGGHAAKPEPTAQDWSAAAGALGAAADILSNRRSREIGNVHSHYASTLWKLFGAVSGFRDGVPLSAADRNAMFQDASRELAPAIELYATDADGKAWLDDHFYAEFNATTKSMAFSSAKERVHNAVVTTDKQVVEIPPENESRERGKLLHAELAKLIPMMKQINEQLVRMNEHGIEHGIEALLEGHKAHGKAGSLVELGNVLMLADGWLTLNDEEFKHHLSEIHGVFNGIATYSELVKAITELTGGAIGITASATALIARATGNAAYAGVATGIAQKTGVVFAEVVSAIEIVHGVFVMLDPHATRQQKVDAAVDIAAGTAWFTGRYAAGAVVGAAASTAILAGYAELRWAVTTYWASSIGLNTMFLGQAYETLAMHGDSIARAGDELLKAEALVQQEKDPAKQHALQQVLIANAGGLGSSVDSLIIDCGPAALEAGVARKPGAYPILRQLFAPLAAHRGAKDPQAAAQAAAMAMQKIAWAREHAPDIVVESTRNRDLHAVEQDAVERERKAHEGGEGREGHGGGEGHKGGEGHHE